jgi:hypothetical protein
LVIVIAAPKAVELCGVIVYTTLHEVPVGVPAEVTASMMVVDAVSVPEVPVMVTAEEPVAAELLAENVTMLLPVTGLAPNAAVTPLGRLEVASVTVPVKLPISVTVTVSVALELCPTDNEVAEGVSVKLGVAVTANVTVVDAVSVPDVPVIVTVAVPDAAALLAVNVSTLLPVAGLVPNAAVTPLGKPDAASVTVPVKPFKSVTVIVSVALEPGVTETVAAEAVSLKLDAAVTVSAIVVDAVSVPEVPVIVTVDVPAVAVLLAVSVSTLLPVAGLVPNVAVTPAGNPDAARVTLPLNGLTSVIPIVSVPLAPGAIETALAEDESVKLPLPVPPPPVPQATPFKANEVGTALVALFHVPLNPTPVTLPPAGILPL